MSTRRQPALELLSRSVDDRVEVWGIRLQPLVLLNNILQHMSEEADDGGTMRLFEHVIDVMQVVYEVSGKPDEHRDFGECLFGVEHLSWFWLKCKYIAESVLAYANTRSYRVGFFFQ